MTFKYVRFSGQFELATCRHFSCESERESEWESSKWVSDSVRKRERTREVIIRFLTYMRGVFSLTFLPPPSQSFSRWNFSFSFFLSFSPPTFRFFRPQLQSLSSSLSTKNSFSTNLKLKVFWPSLSLSFSIFLCYFLSFSVTFSASNKLVLLNLCSHRSRKSKRETFGGTNYKMKELCFLFVSELWKRNKVFYSHSVPIRIVSPQPTCLQS